MKRARTFLALATLAWPHGDLLVLAANNKQQRRYGQFPRRRGSYRTSARAITACSSTRCFLVPSSPVPLRVKSPRGSRRTSHVRVRPCPRRHYSSEEGSWDCLPGDGDDISSSSRGGYTPAAAETVERSNPNSSAADRIGSAEAGTAGGGAFTLGVRRTSKITKVEVENLAMVDSVSIEVRVRCRIGVPA